MNASRTEERWRPRLVLAVVTTALFIDMVVYGVVVPLIPTYSARLGASPAQIGILFASYGVALLAATPVVGMVSARVERRTLIMLGLGGVAFATLLFARATTFEGLLAARALQGIAAAASWTAGLALLADTFPPERRGRAFGLSSAASSVGTLVGPPFGGLLSDRFGYSAPFLVVALLGTTGGLAAAWALRKGAPRRVVSGAAGVGLVRDGGVRGVCAFVVLGASLLGALEPMLPIHLTSAFDASRSEVGLLFAAATMAFGVAAPVAGWIADRRGTALPMRVGWALSALALPLLVLPRAIGVEAAAMAGFGVALAFAMTPTLRALASTVDRLGGDYGVAYAAYNAAYAIGIMLGASVGGLLVGAMGTTRALATFAGGVLVLGVYPALALPSRDVERGARR